MGSAVSKEDHLERGFIQIPFHIAVHINIYLSHLRAVIFIKIELLLGALNSGGVAVRKTVFLFILRHMHSKLISKSAVGITEQFFAFRTRQRL